MSIDMIYFFHTFGINLLEGDVDVVKTKINIGKNKISNK
jgi:predicted chitinase